MVRYLKSLNEPRDEPRGFCRIQVRSMNINAPLTYELGNPNFVIGEKDRFRAGGINFHHQKDYANNDEFEAALLKHLRVSPIAAVVHNFPSMGELEGSKVYYPTEEERNELSQDIVPNMKHVMIVSGSGVNAEKESFFEFQDSAGTKGMCLITSFVEIIMPGTTEGDKFESQDLKTRSEIRTRIPDIYGMVTKANSEASPSAVGYQPTLASDIGALQERTTTSMKGSITSVEAIYVPFDDSTAPGPVTAFAHLDAATTIVSRQEWDYEAAMKAFVDGRKPGVKICVGGYDTSLFEDDIKKALIGHFVSCGEIFSLVIPRDPVTDLVDRSCAFMVIFGEGAEEKALALNGSDLGGWNVSVVKVEEKQRTSEEEEAFNAVYYDKNRRFGISVTGYDTSLPEAEDDLKTALKREFASCGEILHVYISRGDSIAYVYFSGEEAIARALELYGLGSRCTMFGGQEAQARAAGRGEWKLVAMPLTNYASPQHVGGSPCFGYTIPPHVLEWTSKRTVD